MTVPVTLFAVARVFAVSLVMISTGVAIVGAQTVTGVYSFPSLAAGAVPRAGLVEDSAGNYYGVTTGGGVYSDGVIYELSPSSSGYSETVLYSLGGNAVAGLETSCAPALAGNYLYGTLWYGIGANGAVYRFNLLTKKAKILHSFTGGADGGVPWGGVTYGGGALYGTTMSGGTNGFGVVYSLKLNGLVETPLHAFAGGADGQAPLSAPQEGRDGLLHGTTSGSAETATGPSTGGTVYNISKDGVTYSVTHQFQGTDGYDPPFGRLAEVNGTLYGVTYTGGSTYTAPGTGYGTIFKIKDGGTGFKSVYSFAGTGDGAYPYSDLVSGGNGVVYGTVPFNGPNTGAAPGSVYGVDVKTGAFSTIWDFTGGSDGQEPTGGSLLKAKDGAIWGTALAGGDGYGTVYSFVP